MKRIILFAVFIVSVLFSGITGAQEVNPCQEAPAITADAADAIGTIQRTLTNYNGARLIDENYCLVFNISQDSDTLVRSNARVVSLNVQGLLQDHGDHDVYIYGLRLNTGSAVSTPLLTITNNTQNRVIINNLQLTNVRSGLKLEGSGQFEVRGSTITGSENPELRTGRCVEVLSDSAIVRSSTISNCGDGIRIDADNVFLGAADAEHLTDMNDVHDNGVGIHAVSGTGNRWPYNLVRQNGLVGAVDDTAANGIFIDAGANNNIARPATVAEPETGAVLRCQMAESGVILRRELDFNVPVSGEMTIYKTDDWQIYKQANEYVATCPVDETGVCILENTLLSFSPSTCGLADTSVTAMFTSDNSSMLLAEPVDLGRFSTILMPTGEGPTAGPSGVTGGGEAGHELYIEGGENSGGDMKFETSGGSGGTGGSGSGTAGGVATKACTFNSPNGMEFKGSVEMWWWILFILPALFVLRRRV